MMQTQVKNDNATDFIKEFNYSFDNILNKVISDVTDKNLLECVEYIRQIYDYNVKNSGKMNRAVALLQTHKLLTKDKPHLFDKESAFVLGWLLEIFQSFAFVLDDIMDEGTKRRGQLCWYKKVGFNAICDALILQQHVFHLIRVYFAGKSNYMKIIEAFNKISLNTCYGQMLDLRTVSKNGGTNFDKLTSTSLASIYKYKTSYYSFVLPVTLGMIISSQDSIDNIERNEDILFMIGHLFQMQDDFIDCFGDPELTGKIGTDIIDGKCCWPIVTALEICNKDQLKVLSENYGINSEECEKAVKKVYQELNLVNVYEEKVKEMRENIWNEIQKIKESNQCNDWEVLGFVMKQIEKRVK